LLFHQSGGLPDLPPFSGNQVSAERLPFLSTITSYRNKFGP
jgi:hypothetical protein